MSRVLRFQLLLSIAGSAVVAALIAALAYTSGVKTVPDVGGAYVEGIVGQPRTLNPLLAAPTDYPAQSINSLVFSGLVKEDASGTPQPDLASSWEITDDGRSYTFDLRPGVLWQDGQPFTADDVMYTISTIQAPGFPGNPDLAAAWRGAQLTKLDNLTVKITLPQPFAPILDFATVGMLPVHILGKVAPADLPNNAFSHQPIGTGPYRLLSTDLRSVVLEAFPGFYATKPFISRVMLRYYKDDQAVVQAVLKGEVQGDWHVTPQDAPALIRDGHLTFYQAVQPSFSGLCFNLNDPQLSQREVRQAIAFAIDRETLRAQVLHGMAQLANSPIPPNSWAYDATLPVYTFDPTHAQSILQSAGWDQNAGGLWSKDGQALAPVILTDDQPDHVALGTAIAAQLKTFGMAASIQTVPFDRLVKDFLAPRTYQIALLDWDVDGADPDPYALWHSSQATAEGLNFSDWKNSTADGLLENGRKSTDLASRKSAYSQFQSTFSNDLPAFLLFHPVYEYAVEGNIRGVTLPSVIHPWDRFDTLSQWFIKTKRVPPLFH